MNLKSLGEELRQIREIEEVGGGKKWVKEGNKIKREMKEGKYRGKRKGKYRGKRKGK